ncbi:hypothetical protein Bca4012_082757 [Brassica carinata]
MGRLVRLVCGLWNKSANGMWHFEENPHGQGEVLIINRTDSLDGLVERIRITLNLGILTPLALTYQLPLWMLAPEDPTAAPITLMSDKTTPFTVDGKTYLGEGVTEEQHRQAIWDLVGGHPIVCSKHMLELMLNDQQLLLVFRVALEIEMVYGLEDTDDATEDVAHNQTITGDAIISLEGEIPLSPDSVLNYNPSDEVLYGHPLSIEEIQNTLPSFEPGSLVPHPATVDVPPLNLWENMEEDGTYWNGMLEEEETYELNIEHPQLRTEGSIGQPLPPNRRVCAPQPANIIVIDDDDDVSYTGSSEGLNDIEINASLPPPVAIGPDCMVETNGCTTFLAGEGSTAVGIKTTSDNTNNVVGSPPRASPPLEPYLDLTLTVGISNNRDKPESPIDIGDSETEDEDGCGGFGPLF